MIPWGERLGYRYKKPRWAVLAKVADAMFSPIEKLVVNSSRRASSIEHILVVRLDHIGDLLCSFPAIKALRRKFTNARISLLVGPWCREMAQLNENVDEVIVYRAPWFDRQRQSGNKHPFFFIGEMLIGARMLKQKGFDMALDLRGDLRNILLMALSCIPIRVGYSDVGGKFMLTHPVKRNRWQHEIFRALDIVRAIGCDGSSAEIELRPPDEALLRAAKILSELKVNTAPILVVVHPFSGDRARWWTTDGFVRLCQYLRERFGAIVLLTGSSEERKMVERIRQPFKEGIFNLSGALSLHELIALVSLADCVITVNTCTMHFAAALGTPQVVLFSSQVHTVEWAPIQGQNILLHSPTKCAGCELPACPLPNHPCISSITPEQVIEAFCSLMPVIEERAAIRKLRLMGDG
ncbi:MAG: glycosyltransferase family 9 protein [Armatimonadetes bacterium]|nr:glycosyltransferase family 9 protein [Armatimonadota bacterium]